MTLKALIWISAILLAYPVLGSGDSPLKEAPTPLSARELGIGRWVPDLELTPVSGSRFRLSDPKMKGPVVIAFTSTTCPVSKRYGSTLAQLEKEYGSRGVHFVLINPVATDSKASAKEAIRNHGWSGPYIRDESGRLSAILGARSTAEVFVLDAAHTLVFRGAVDDQYGLGYSKDKPTRRYLASALDALLTKSAPKIQATSAPGCELEKGGAMSAAKPITYHSRISRILQEHCLNCHHSGGVGPFPLDSLKEVSAHAGMILRQVKNGQMPPWFATPTPGQESPWLNDRSLTTEDKADLLAWLEGGRPEGNPNHAPLPKSFSSEWEIGPPDVTITIPQPIEVPANGVMPYQNVFVKAPFDGDRWVQGWEVRPTAREVVHHVLVHVVPPGKNLQELQRQGGGAGKNFLAAYVPGHNSVSYPEGFAKFIPAGSALHFQLHYTPGGTATRDQTSLGLIFSKAPPLQEVHVSAISSKLDIPPGDPNHRVEGTITVPYSAKLISLMPHMHLRGKAYRYELQVPGGTNQTLLDVPHYDFNWQLQYRFAQFVEVPQGSVLRGIAHYDNSTNNPANPDPTQRVTWGEQTYEEMMLGYIEYFMPGIPPGSDIGSPMRTGRKRNGKGTFETLDRNKDGRITPDEAPSAAQFREADTDGNGIVTPEELRAFLRKRQTENKPNGS